MFGQGDLRIVILHLLEEKPRHGYEVIKALEERSGGTYAPSAGAVYPTLTMLEEMGYASSADDGGKKVYSITAAGRDFLRENQSTADDLFERLGEIGATVFSDGMREIGRAFGHLAKATFSASRRHLRDDVTTGKILEILEKASADIEAVLRGAGNGPAPRDGEPRGEPPAS